MARNKLTKPTKQKSDYVIPRIQKPVTPEDKLATTSHLVDTIGHNLNHGVKHMIDAKAHAQKLEEHLKANPQLNKAHKELHARVKEVHQAVKKAGKLMAK